MCAELQYVKYLFSLSGEILYCRGCYFKCCLSVVIFYRVGDDRVYFTVNVICVRSLFSEGLNIFLFPPLLARFPPAMIFGIMLRREK